MPKSIEVVQVDAFTSRPYAGNPAVVVLRGEGLDDARMQAIAREMNLSETAFLSPARLPGAAYRLRWMTPSVEVNFCGHATVATVHAMQEAGLLRGNRVVFETRNGLLPVAAEDDWIWLEPAAPSIEPVHEDLKAVLAALEMPRSALAAWAPPSLGGERDLLLPCATLKALGALAPDPARLTALGVKHGWRGYCLTTLETFEASSSIHSRFFAPQSGVFEDPVTGSVHASLAIYVTAAGKAPDRFTAEQGDFMQRPGRLRIEVQRRSGRVRVGGQAVTVLRGALRVPEA
jgi:PhzF family phenazine biosynthesis protein